MYIARFHYYWISLFLLYWGIKLRKCPPKLELSFIYMGVLPHQTNEQTSPTHGISYRYLLFCLHLLCCLISHTFFFFSFHVMVTAYKNWNKVAQNETIDFNLIIYPGSSYQFSYLWLSEMANITSGFTQKQLYIFALQG